MEEIWKDIPEYEGYQISNLGRVRSLKTNNITTGSHKNIKSDYLRVGLYKNKNRKFFFVHDLVAFAFPEICGEYFEGAVCNHKNEIKKDNRAENLEWCDVKYNCNYGTRNARISNGKKNENNPFYGKHISEYQRQRIKETNSKQVFKYTKDNILICKYNSIKEAAIDNNIAAPNISNCCNNKNHNKTAGGYIWKFL